ncbi:MAG: NAD(P)/FAD-dependent oxidoreductase [Lysobacterales bacterium]|nr:MAG: NAD(P)/FAD-dependent oxidoreductase [Xanthomonadales bacterium]
MPACPAGPVAVADVAIIGGGLAGLTLALQLRSLDDSLDIAVLERNNWPMPDAAHKVGESTVEIGAHYLADTIGAAKLLQDTQLRKFGLRFFFGSGNHDDLARADELGASRLLAVPGYQIDRGRLENDLAARAVAQDVRLLPGAVVRKVELAEGGGKNRIFFEHGGGSAQLECTWVVDAASRASVLKRQMKLNRESTHRVSAAWFRLDHPVQVDDWSGDTSWKGRCLELNRRHSTNHLMGSGYWVWIIPLREDRTSIGIVADSAMHPAGDYNSFDKSLRWLEEKQPVCHERLRPHAGSLMDFRMLRNFANDCGQLWSPKGWALSGEAGVFADPFYSPGTDFIAISNTFIADLITRKRTPAQLQFESMVFEKIYRSFLSSTMSLYRDLYPGFGDARLMALKSTWDFAYYWSVLALLFFRGCMTDLPTVKRLEPVLTRLQQLNLSVQGAFRKRAGQRLASPGEGRFFDQCRIPVLVRLNRNLVEPQGSVDRELASNAQTLEGLAPALLELLDGKQAGRSYPTDELGDLRQRLG